MSAGGNSSAFAWTKPSISMPLGGGADDVASRLLAGAGSQDLSGQPMTVNAKGWSRTLAVNRVVRATTGGTTLEAKQLGYVEGILPADQADVQIAGAVLCGSDQTDRAQGLAGWDLIDTNGGNDHIRAGNGRDVINGGDGRDQIWGDFGWNTYNGNRDGQEDLIVIKSDQHLENWWYGKDGNSPNGEKADVIEDLDAIDRIRILGVTTEQISVSQASAHGLEGLGIFADGFLEALYIGNDLNLEQLLGQVDGDASEAVMNNTQGFYEWG